MIGLDDTKIEQFTRKWLKLLPHPFTEANYQAGFRYDISMLQTEFSLTQVLDRRFQVESFLRRSSVENLDSGRPDKVALIFDRRVTKRAPEPARRLLK